MLNQRALQAMLRHAAVSTLVLFALGFTGCMGSHSVPMESPRSLAEVNRTLEGRTVQIAFGDSTVVSGERVTVMPDSVHFLAERSFESVAVGEVLRITYDRDRFSPEQGAVGGVVFGGGLIAVCLLSEEPAALCAVVAGVVLMGSAIVGAGFGLLEQTGAQEKVAYEGPVSRYLGVKD